MTEYETASLAIQHVGLETNQLSVWVAAVVGLVQSGMIAWGLWLVS